MFLASKEDPDNNWLSNVNADHSQALQVYLYSFYFTTTTILTVGYGDLSPKNLTEVAVVIFVEIFGKRSVTQGSCSLPTSSTR